MKTNQNKQHTPLIKALSISSLISLIAVAGCQHQAPGLQNTALQSIAKGPSLSVSPLLSQGTITSTPQGNGKAKLTVHMRFENPSNTAFKTQAVDCTGQMDRLRVKVIGLGMGELLPLGADTKGYLGDYTAGECDFSATFENVPVGNARIITVEAYDSGENKLSGYSLSGLIDVVGSLDPQNPTVSETEISFRSTAAGMLAKSLAKGQGMTGEALFSGMTAADIQAFVDPLIFGSAYNGAIHGNFPNYVYATHPLLLNYQVLAQHLVNVNGDLSVLPTTPSSYTLQASRLNITGLDDTMVQTIRVSDPASQTFVEASPALGDTSQLLTGILPGTWNVSVDNGSNVFNGILSFAPNITTEIAIGATVTPASWELMTKQPETANINAFQRDPVMNSTTHILGTTKGVYLFDTPDSNQWNPKGLKNYNILSVESGFDGNTPRRDFFAGTEGQGIFKTTDSGANWSRAVESNGFDNLSIYEMHARVSDSDPGVVGALFAATNDGVVEYRRTSEPTPWSKVNTVLNGSSLAGSAVSSIIETDPNGSPHLIITVPEGPNAGVYASLNRNPGNGWYKIDEATPTLATSQPYRLSLDNETSTLFVMGKNGAIFSLSTFNIDIALNTTIPDVSGLSWTSQIPFDTGYGNQLNPDASQLYAATTAGVKQNSNPPISTWNEVSSSNPLPNNEVSHIENLNSTGLFDMIAFTRGGIAKYGSTSWETFSTSGPESNTGLRGADIKALHADESTGTFMYVGTRYAGVFKYDNDNDTYSRLPPLPAEASKEILDMDQDGTGSLVVLTPTGVYILNNPGIGGGSWIAADNFPSGFKASHLTVTPSAVPSSDSIVYVSSAESMAPTGIYAFNCSAMDCHSNALSVSWFQSYTLPVHSLFALGNISVYAGAQDATGNHQVIKTTNGGGSWDGLNGVAPINGTSPIDMLYSSGFRVIAVSTAQGPAGIRGLDTANAETTWANLGNNLFVSGSERLSSLAVAGSNVYLGLSQGGVRTLNLSMPQSQWGQAQWFGYSQTENNQSPGQYTPKVLTLFPAGNTPISLWAATTEQGLYRTNGINP